MNLYNARRQGFPQFRKNRKANCERAEYIFELAQANRRDISQWNIESFYKRSDLFDVDMACEMESRKRITEIFLAKVRDENTPESMVAGLDAAMFAELDNQVKIHASAETDSLLNEYYASTELVEVKQQELVSALAVFQQIHKRYRLANGELDSIQLRFEECLKSISFYKFFELDLPNLEVRLVTPEIFIREVNPAAAVDVNASLGSYLVTVNAYTMDFKVSSFKGGVRFQTTHDSQPAFVIHPCIVENKSICWGELVGDVANAHKRQSLYSLLNYLRQLFYSAGAPPYVDIFRFAQEAQLQRDVAAGITPAPDGSANRDSRRDLERRYESLEEAMNRNRGDGLQFERVDFLRNAYRNQVPTPLAQERVPGPVVLQSSAAAEASYRFWTSGGSQSEIQYTIRPPDSDPF